MKKKIENGENIYNIDKKDRTKIERQIFTDAGISSSSAQKGGFLMELIMSMVQEHLVKAEGDNVHFNVIHSGDTKVRPDITITTKLEIESIFQGAFKTIREENITDRESINKIYNDINEKLEKIDSGWIVHENLKNYSLGGDFFESLGGFSAGSAIPITTFKALLESNNAAGINPAQLVGLVKQMIPGSWMIKNQGYMRDVVKDFVGSAISHFLFDDIATVGQTMERFKGVTGHQIHLFYLDGFFVPLSLYLRLLGEAFTEAEQNIDELVRVDIKTPGSITYQKKEDLQAQGISQLWTSAEWEQQREDADAITISYHFLHNFVNLIHELTS